MVGSVLGDTGEKLEILLEIMFMQLKMAWGGNSEEDLVKQMYRLMSRGSLFLR